MNKKNEGELRKRLQHIRDNFGSQNCADCNSRGPTWASFSLGIFLCMECAGIHRSLGTHISRVRSITLDKWDSASVQRMHNIGNEKFNASWEALLKPHERPPFDASMDARETFIRNKYVRQQFKDSSRDRSLLHSSAASSPQRRSAPTIPASRGDRASAEVLLNTSPHTVNDMFAGLKMSLTSSPRLEPSVSSAPGQVAVVNPANTQVLLNQRQTGASPWVTRSCPGQLSRTASATPTAQQQPDDLIDFGIISFDSEKPPDSVDSCFDDNFPTSQHESKVADPLPSAFSFMSHLRTPDRPEATEAAKERNLAANADPFAGLLDF